MNRRRIAGLLALTAISAVACGGTSVSGTINGDKFAASHAIFYTDQGFTALVLSNETDVCDQLNGDYLHPGENAVVMSFYAVTADGNSQAADASGTYSVSYEMGDGTWAPVTSGNIAYLEADQLDANCGDTLGTQDDTGIWPGLGVSGTVTVDKFDTSTKGEVSGSFSAKVGSQQDTLSGHFSATYCEYTNINDATAETPVCK